ncbi:pentapeptide repeat-containing protein [Actinoplanes sp. CA-030573]|uniref:pentapeptide repeat-containing protein n=1 Tax=Actinoplanes sp. CA-030573 TaxID=3239898 RepID=UPI003D946732
MARRALNAIVAANIRRYRTERKWSARILSEHCTELGMSSLTREVIAKIESGRRGIDMDEAMVFAAALGVTLEELTTEAAVTILHLSDLGMAPDQHGQETAHADFADRLLADLAGLRAEGLQPDIVVISGDLGRTGRPREYDLVRAFLQRLLTDLKITFDRVAIVPGEQDVNLPATQAYFNVCIADDIEPRAPYWSNWQRFALLLDAWPDESRDMRMHAERPWSLFEMRDLRVVVAGLNSTLRDTPERGEHSGAIDEEQAVWFAEQLAAYERQGWFRIGLLHHNPLDETVGPNAALTDAGVLSRELGNHLNLVLHGHGSGRAGRLTAGTLALGVGVPYDAGRHAAARYQIIKISPAGLLRAVRRYDLDQKAWVADDEGRTTAEIAEDWDQAQGTFGSLAGQAGQRQVHEPIWRQPGAGWEPGETGDDDGTRPRDARQVLLDQVADVCLVRNADAVVQRIKSRPPYLRVTYQDDGRSHQMRIGAWVGPGLDEARIDEFQAVVNYSGTEPPILVYQGVSPSDDLRQYAGRRHITLRSFLQFQGLVDFTDYVTAQTQQLAADPEYRPDDYVPHRYTDVLDPAAVERKDVVEELLAQVNAPDGRFILLLGDFGRGKTFALHELARRIPQTHPHLTPILIDLRMLDKAQTLEAHVAAHLANLHDEFDMRALRYMMREGRLVLIFDGFDELVFRATYARAGDHLQTLISGVTHSAKIVVAGRTQHFQTHDQIMTAMGARVRQLPQRRIYSLADLSDEQIRILLTNRYGGDTAAAERRFRLLGEIAGLAELAQNPRMLTFIAELDEDRLRAVAESRLQVSPAGLYQHILDDWLAHEESRTQAVPGALLGFGKEDLWTAVTTLALRMWESNQPSLGVEELGDVARTLVNLADSHLSADQIVYTVGSGSLLVRTEDGMFNFIHESVREWLVAHWIAERLSADPDAPLAHLDRHVLSALTIDFLCGLAEAAILRRWATATRAESSGAGEIARNNAARVLARIDLSEVLTLRHALLSNEDLSDRSWPRADLTGADLGGARMRNMDLRHAKLVDARLAGAVLDRADLTGADLTGADLRGVQLTKSKLIAGNLTGARLTDARLLGTDLTGALADDIAWDRAVLVNVVADPELLEQARAGGAAVVPSPDVQVETAFLPPSIGVRFGFQEGRLPRPVAYNNDGALLAIGNEDGSILICDAVSGAPLRTLVGHRWRAYVVMFSPRHALLASGSLFGDLRLWDANTGRCLFELPGCDSWVWPMLFNVDGSLLAAGSNDGVVRIWETTTGRLRWELDGHTPPVWTASFSSDGRYLATGDEGGRSRLWDMTTGELARPLETRGQLTYWIRFDRAGDRLAGGGKDGKVLIWDPETGEAIHRLEGHTAAVYALDFHPDGRSIVSADTSGSVRQWDLLPSRPVGRELGRHTGAVYRITFSPDGELFATGDSDGSVRLWEAASGHIRHDLAGHHASVWPMMFRPDGKQLATSSNDYTMKLWDTSTGELVRQPLRGHGRRMLVVSFSRDGKLLAASSNDGVIRLWDAGTGRCAATLRHEPDLLLTGIFSPQTDEIATASNDGRVYLWDAEAAVAAPPGTRIEEDRLLDLFTDTVWATVFSPSAEFIATANDDDTLQIMFRATGRTVQTLQGRGGRARALAFSPDDEELAAAGDDHHLYVWKWREKAHRQFPHEHEGRIFSLAYSPDGNLIATAGHDGLAVIWNADDGTVRHRIRPIADQGESRLWTVAFDPYGRFLATGGDGHTVDIWSVETGEPVQRLAGHNRRIWSVAYSPDGKLIASSSTDGTVRLWRVGDDGRGAEVALLLGLPNGWVAVTPNGRYKTEGVVTDQFWHIVGMARFEPGDLDPYLPDLRQIEADAPLF